MGIDIHAFNFIKYQASRRPLGSVLTIGRQSLGVDPAFIEMELAQPIERTGYCEPLLLALNAERVASLDFSDYEGATFVADLNQPISIEDTFDTVIDSGSLEHVFDVANAFRNTINLCKMGGRVFHFLPVNNLNGHGFWQFSSDLIYSIYSEENGFAETEVYYASSLDPSYWYRMPDAKPGIRIEVVSLEPIILLSATRKVRDVQEITVMQPFYAPAWSQDQATNNITAEGKAFKIKSIAKRVFVRRRRLINLIRNFHLVIGLMTGSSRYSLNNRRFKKIRADTLLRGSV
jgi:SAM-dependent methyltransferase